MMVTPDLAQLPAPNVVEPLDFETILAAARADLVARYPAAAEVIELESEPLAKLLEVHAARELVYRQRVNDAARAYLISYATGADLDHKGAFYGVPRLAGETDERYRKRIQLRIRALAGNGTREAYEVQALTASQNVYDAVATQPRAGHVLVLLWLHDATHAAATLAAVLDALNADDARPLGVPVSVAMARPKPVHITARVQREAGAPLNIVAQLQASLASAMGAYARLGRAVPRSWVTTRLHVDGIASVQYPDAAAPAELTPMAADEYPVLGAVRIIDGGIAA